MYRYQFLVLYIFITAFSSNVTHSFAAAWTQGKDSGQTIITLNQYQSSHSFDTHGNSLNAGSKFNKYEINPFIEYGLTNDITIGASPIVQYWQTENPSNKSQITGFSDCNAALYSRPGEDLDGYALKSEFFLRKKLLELGNIVFSIQPLVKTPCVLTSGTATRIFWNSYDLELRGLAGYGFKWDPKLIGEKIRPFAGQYHFINLETAYRKRAGGLSDQVKIDGTLGIRYNENLLFLGQIFSTISTDKEPINIIETSPGRFYVHKDKFSNTKLQLSGVTQVSKTASVQLGVHKDIAGKNYGDGRGIILSLWKGF